ncbi:zinc metalloprotease [Pseudomonas protegens]|uniref:hypothetical protein n=1 Tax=Pseudomonas protegens TaxID=380021 RepID=UPI00200FFD92|nr:hypothetical protein [Pseudomonas protegens]
MAVSSSTRNQLRTTLHHELGHWLVARHFGFKAGEVSVRLEDQQVLGTSLIEPYAPVQLADTKQVRSNIFNRMVVLCAGVVADIASRGPEVSQAVIDDAFNKGVMDETGLTDRGKVEELLFILVSIDHEASSDTDVNEDRSQKIFGEAYGRAQELIKEFFPKLELMATFLRQGRENAIRFEFPYERVVRAELDAIAQLSKSQQNA